MVEFQGGAAGPIAAVLTFASPESDEPLFPLSPPLPEISHQESVRLRLRNASASSLAPAGFLDVLCSPNGEHSRQNFRRYRDRITPLMRSLEGNSRPQATQVFIWTGRGVIKRGLRRALKGRQATQYRRPCK